MRKDAIQLEEARLTGIGDIEHYPSFHERHRVFPAVFEDRKHKHILDLAAGMGVVGKRVQDLYNAELICNDICPTCITSLQGLGLKTASFDIDDDGPFPFPERHFDAVIALATIEHVISIDHFMEEIHRVLRDNGCLYISAPNYSGLPYLVPFLLSGKTFHDPLKEPDRYEFYAHVRYFTYKTLIEFTGSFGFRPEAVYLPLPQSSSKYQKMKKESRLKAKLFRYAMQGVYTLFSPRWAAEPVICLRKDHRGNEKIRKVIM